ncbi:MAG: hypothetical protein HOJ99_01360 [Porticoccaceae bacterium]|nr:hypothetical protein [Porticoccaceae bacterium]
MTNAPRASSQLLFNAFKYTVYALLTLNIFLFYQEESLATTLTFSQGINLDDIIQGYAATIDTAAWVILLLMFELETSVLDNRTVRKPGVQLTFAGLRLFSYGFILYSCYGYIGKMLLTYDVSVFPVDDICALVGQRFAGILTLDEYPMLDQQNCQLLAEQTLYRLNNQPVLGTAEQWTDIQWLAWVDVINSVAWIAVVIMLEVDVWLQLRDKLEGQILVYSKITKLILYSILFAAAVYWGLLGDFLDFWDAFLWLVAFFFIEMNVLKRQAETQVQ